MLKDKVTVITGGARGIGKAVASELAKRGSHIVVSDVDLDGALETAKELETLGIQTLALKADVSNASDVENMFSAILDRFGKLDVLVNNAGITRDMLIMRMKEEDWDLVLRINLKGAFLCTKEAIRPMMKQRSGKIINMASIVGVIGNIGQANYSASKAGLIGLTKSTAKEVASKNIQVNAIAPGFIESDMTRSLSEKVVDAYLANIPAKKFGSTDDVANLVAFLASSESDYITGQVIHVDGGLVM